MALLQLQNIGKIYAGEGSIAVGIRGVDLSFDRGEIVAVTGKSGSGKSTLLNVISGMDSYEEGELFIEGKPTSHYMQPDWEEYRKQYISFIFQDYNIIESFTVLQNVELALMHIESSKERRARALELLRRVGLERSINQKGSRLSGGQKQRTVIARALAKDSPIILADEPTGNLDAATSKEIISLLREVSKDKLLIIVTHSFDELEGIATRHIRIYDGAVESDTRLAEPENVTSPITPIGDYTKAGIASNGFMLGRAIFTSKPWLSLFMCVLLIAGTLGIFGLTAINGDALYLFRENYMFTPIEGRDIIARRDGKALTEDEIVLLRDKYGADDSVHFDAVFDSTIDFCLKNEDISESINGNYDFYTHGYRLEYGKEYGKPTAGRYPEKDGEIFLYTTIADASVFDGSDFKPVQTYVLGIKSTIVGYKTFKNTSNAPKIIGTRGYFDACAASYLLDGGSISAFVSVLSGNGGATSEKLPVVLDFDVPVNTVLIKDKTLADFSGSSSVYTITYNSVFTTNQSFVRKNFTHSEPCEIAGGTEKQISVNPASIIGSVGAAVVESGNYLQASLFFGSDKKAGKAAEKINSDGTYIAVTSNVEAEPELFEVIIYIIAAIFSVIMWVLGVIFIAFFINLCSSNAIGAFKGEMAIMRSMGIPVKIITIGMYFRMLISAVPAIIMTIVTSAVLYAMPRLVGVIEYLKPWQYAVIFAGVLVIVLRVTRKQVRKLFGESVKKSIRGGRT